MSNKPDKLNETPEWSALQRHQAALENISLQFLFEEDQKRFQAFHLSVEGVLFDYSKNHVTQETITYLCNLARACNIEQKRTDFFSGKTINTSENRAVLHPALRHSTDPALEIDQENIRTFVENSLTRIESLTQSIQAKNIADVVSIGIGGSSLGPQMVCRALPQAKNAPRLHFLSNIDGDQITRMLSDLNPETTLFLITSKTFTTLETISNAEIAKSWLQAAGQNTEDHFIAVTANTAGAETFGVSAENILPLRDWIGGRYSVWSAVGLPIALSAGFENFKKFLSGARAADTHFLNSPLEKNIPVLMALIGIWYRNFWNFPAAAILPYIQSLNKFPAYIQQLDMESNGKSVSKDGHPLSYATGPVVFGDIGTDAQHAFMQFLHQGTNIIPADFIIAARHEHLYEDHHIKLVSNALAQAKALMEGAENIDKPHAHFPGNRPSSIFILDRLDAYHLGLLMALYEHKIFVQGAIWNINSFDQWGVELGKLLAQDIIDSFNNDNKLKKLDNSTRSLLDFLREKE